MQTRSPAGGTRVRESTGTKPAILKASRASAGRPPAAMTAPGTESEVFAVCLADAGPTVIRQFLSASNPDQELLVIPVVPGPLVHQRRTLQMTLLEALGKDKSVGNRQWNRRGHIAQQSVAWLIAHDIRDIVLVHAEWLHPALIKDIALVAAQVPLRLTLVMLPGPGEEQMPALSDWCLPQPAAVLPAAVASALNALAAPPVPAEADVEAAAFDGPLPLSDPFTFLTACQRLLPNEQFRQVRAWYSDYVSMASDGCDANAPLPVIADWIWRSMLLVGRSNAEFTIFLRAVQLVLAEHNVLLDIKLDKLAASAAARPTRLANEPAWRTIRGYRFPEQAATLALSQCGLELHQLHDLTVSDVRTPDGRTLTVGGEATAIPDRSAIHIRALLAQHAQLGSTPAAHLLSGPSGPMDLNEISWLISRGGHQNDLAVQTVRHARTISPTVLAKLRRYGIYFRDYR